MLLCYASCERIFLNFLLKNLNISLHVSLNMIKVVQFLNGCSLRSEVEMKGKA